MLIDLMINNMSYNVKLATIIGIEGAIYINSLCNMLNKNSYVESDFFKMDREYITSVTGLSGKTQLALNNKLNELNIIDIDDTTDKIKLNISKVIDIICEEDKSKIKLIQKFTKTKTTNGLSLNEKVTKRQGMINNLKTFINCSNEELTVAYENWVDGVYANPKGFLSKRSIEVFQKTINDYTKGDLDLALVLLDIATVNGYRDATWAINNYNNNKKQYTMEAPKPKTREIKFKDDETF